MLSSEGPGTGARVPAPSPRFGRCEQPRRDAAVHGPRTGDRVGAPGLDPARPPGVLRGHARRGPRGGLARRTPDHLRDPLGRRKGGYQVGVDHGQPGQFLFRPCLPPCCQGIPDSRGPCASSAPPSGARWATLSSGPRAFWARPWYQLRRELGLPSTAEPNPLVDGLSPLLHLALFSRWLADKQTNWPAQTAITGFPFHDRDGAGGLPPDLARFLNEGPPSLVFT